MALSSCNILTMVYPNTKPNLHHSDHSVPKHTPWLCKPATCRPLYPNMLHGFVNLQHSDHSVPKHKAQPATFRPQCIQTQSMALSACNIQTTVYPNTKPMALSALQNTDHGVPKHSPWLCQPATFRPVYPNTQPMALSACNIQTSVPKHTAHSFVCPATFRPQCTQTHSPWLCQPATYRPQCTQTHSPRLCHPATFRPQCPQTQSPTCNIQTTVYPNTQPMALSACNIQTSVPKHTAHGFVSLQHSDQCTQTHSPRLCQPATFRPQCNQTVLFLAILSVLFLAILSVLFLAILYHRVQFQCAHMHADMCVCVWESVRAQERDREKERVSESTTVFSYSSDFVLYCNCSC